MQKHLQKLLLILALLLPGVTNAQTLTVANGTATNTYVPIYGYYCDADQHNQMVYPSSMLTDMSGSLITSLTFYQSQAASSSWGTTVTIKLKEITDSTLSDLVSTAGATTVWTGIVNGTTATQVFNFSSPFVYAGGNLLVDITTTEADYSQNYWYGISRSNSSVWAYYYGSTPTSISSADDGDVESFLPKATFGYTTGSFCMPPSNFAASVSGDTVSFTWNDTSNTSWQLVWGPVGFNPDTAIYNVANPYTTSYELTDMADGFYEAYIQAICTDDSSFWIGPVNFNIGIIIMNMATSGSDTLRTCNATIYDDGGPTGSYSNSISSSILVIYPSDNLHALSISGSSYTESTFDYLRIYSGIGTSGETLFDDYGVSTLQHFGPFYSTTPITVYFHTDGSVTYSGFEINVGCVPMPDCQMPETFVSDNLRPDAIDFHWTDNNASAWTIAYGPSGFTLGDTNTVYVDFYDTAGTVTGLMANTLYDFYLMAVCSPDTSWARMLTLRTACSFLDSLPYVNNFESEVSGGTTSTTFVNCWFRLNNGTQYFGYPYVSSSSTYNHTAGGTRGLYWYNTTTTGTYGDYQCVVLPGIDTSVFQISDLQLGFWTAASSSSYYPTFQVGVMTDPTNINTFQQVASVTHNSGTGWEEHLVSFENFTGSGCYLAVKATRASWTCYVDDFRIEQAPDCPRVEAVAASNITPNTADISWTEMGSATSWTVVYGPQGFSIDTGTTSVEYTNSTTLTGLTANTAYDVYITPDCGGVAGINMISFRTECDPMDTLPLFMSFESSEGVSTGGSTNRNFVECWHRLNNGTTYYGYPYVANSTTYAHTGSRGLYYYMTTTTGTYGDYEIVVLPAIDVTTYPINTLQFKFWARSSSSSYYPVFQVGVMSDPNDVNTFHQLAIINVSNSTQWEEFTTGLSGYTGSGAYVALRANRTGSSWYAYVDDLTLEVAPSCPTVNNIVVNRVGTAGALASWGYQTGFAETPETYDVSVYEMPSNTLTASYSASLNTQLISGLSPNTQYKLVVVPICATETGGADSVYFSTNSLPCLIADTTTNDTVVFSTGTDQVSGVFVNTSWGNTFCQSIYTAQELNAMGVHSGRIKGVRLGYSSSGSYNKEFTIFMGNTTINSFSTTSNMVNPSTLTQVYGPTVRTNTSANSGWVYYEFDTAFVWDGNSNIILSTFMNQSGSSQSSSGFYGYSTASNINGASIYKYKDSNPFTISDCLSSGNSGSAQTARPSITFITDGCSQTGTCSAPLVVIDSLDTNYIAVNWAPGYQESSWEVEYRVAGATTWTSEGSVSVPGYIISGLNANTTYEIRITAECTDTNISAIVSAHTPCAPYAIPFHENFASFPTNGSDPLPSCWTKHTNYSTNYPYASTSYSISGGRSIYMYSSNNTYSYMVLPPFDAPLDTLQVSFWLYRTNTSYTHEIWVGIMSDPDDVSTFEQVGIAAPSALTTWEAFEIPLNNYHGNGQYIALMSPNGQYSYPYLDELTVEYISPCPRVRNVTVSNIGLHSARVNWDTTAASSYEIEYGPAGFAFGSGTLLTGIVGDTHTITGLSASSQYDVYVRGLCSPDTSNWSFVNTFFTQCGLIDSVPFFQNFNSIGTSTSTHSPQCWYGTSTYSSSYPYPSSSYSRSGGGAAMYMYLYTPSSYYTMLQLPPVDTTVLPINTLQVEFSLLRTNTTYQHGVVVGICTDQGMQNFTPIDTVVVTEPTGVWQDFEIPFNNYTGYGNYITFKAYAGSSSYCYPYLDDILLEHIPSCIRPDSLYSSNATSSTVVLGWRERGTATAWEIEYGAAGFTPGIGVGTTVVAYTNPVTITGLPASFEGDFYVRSICSVGDTSLFSREACTFSTSQLPASIPYYYDFEDATEWAAWQTSTNTTINWARGTAEVDSGNYAMYISPNGGLTYGNENFSSVVNAAVFRDVDFGTIDTSFTLTYRAKVGGTVSARYDALMVFLVDPAIAAVPSSSNITSPWGNVNDLYRISLAYLDTTWSTYTASFDTIHGVKRVAFFWFNQNTGASYPFIGGPAAVDNIHIVYSSCPRPLNLEATSVSSTTATLHWDGSPTASYRVAYREYGAPASTNVYINVNTNSVTLTGLNPSTTYRAWVQKLCGSDSSLFSDGVEFLTDMCDNAIITAVGSSSSTGTSYLAPVNNYYNYTLTETIIDSAEIDGPMDIGYLSYYYNYTTASSVKNNCTVYFQPTTLSTFASASDVVPLDTATAVKVYTGPLNCTEGWNYFPLDTTYHYDGSSNLLVIVDDNSGSYNGSAYVFKTEPCTGNKVLYYYSDSYNPDLMTISSSYSGTKAVASWRPVMQLVSCGMTPVCRQPIITGTSHTYESLTATWTGTGSAYEVNIKETTAADFTNADIPVVGNSYTFYGLQPATSYTVRVRQDCSADSLGYSEWVLETVVTDSLPCLPPDSLTVTDMTNADATFDWVPFGYETMWEVHVWNTAGFDSTYTVSTHPVVLGGYTAGVTYNASVRPLCGSAHNIQGDWCDTVTFTAATCPDVTGLTASEVGASSLRLNWTANPAADSWVIEYGYTGFEQGTGTQATSSTPSYVVTGLQEETGYDFYVRAQCGTDWYSENWAYVSATTEYSGVICDAPTGVSAVVAGNAATVSWTPGEGNISYELEYGPHGFAHGNGITQSATSSPVTIPNLNYETQYDVYVRAFCEQNASSAWSVVTSFTTEAQGSEDCDPVTNLTATEITENSAVISWTAGATGTEWEVVLTNASGATLSEARTNEQRYQLNGLTPGTSYIVKVRTVCGDDQYSDYASTSFTTIAVGIDGVAEASCTIYPNPTSSATTISVSGVSGKVKIAVVDMNGRTVASELLECSSDCTKTMDVERLAQGAYFVRITGENVNMVKKLIVK